MWLLLSHYLQIQSKNLTLFGDASFARRPATLRDMSEKLYIHFLVLISVWKQK